MNKITITERIIGDAMENWKNPVIMFSGGKDSVVLTEIITQRMDYDIPLIFHKEPFFTEKYAFGEDVVRLWGLVAHDYPPLRVSMWKGKDINAYTNHYQIGNTKDGAPVELALPKNIVEPEKGVPFLCGLKDFINRPTAFYNYPWDLAFIGHKNVDEDQIAGKVPLHSDFVRNEFGPSLCFPLRHWTHEEIWDYIEENDLPVQMDRYQNRKELPEKTMNSDYFHACIRCINPDEPSVVNCPKLNGAQVNNISSRITWQDLKLDYFG